MSNSNNNIKVLVVEDDEFLLNIYVTTFEKEGFKVMAAKNGEEGLRLTKEALPSVVLLDILLPGGKNGLDVLRELKDEPETASIPIMIMSNLADDVTISEGMALGANGYFTKSQFNPDDVVRNILTIVSGNKK